MDDRADREVAFEDLERLLRRDQLNVILPEQGRIAFGEIELQQIAAFAAADVRNLSRLSEKLGTPVFSSGATSAMRQAEGALERAAPRFIRRSLSETSMLAIVFNRAQSPLCRRCAARSLATRSALCVRRVRRPAAAA